jgi:hypothetical protein
MRNASDTRRHYLARLRRVPSNSEATERKHTFFAPVKGGSHRDDWRAPQSKLNGRGSLTDWIVVAVTMAPTTARWGMSVSSDSTAGSSGAGNASVPLQGRTRTPYPSWRQRSRNQLTACWCRPVARPRCHGGCGEEARGLSAEPEEVLGLE